MDELEVSKKVSVMWLGKVKTMPQMLAWGGLLWRQSLAMEILAIIMLYCGYFNCMVYVAVFRGCKRSFLI